MFLLFKKDLQSIECRTVLNKLSEIFNVTSQHLVNYEKNFTKIRLSVYNDNETEKSFTIHFLI